MGALHRVTVEGRRANPSSVATGEGTGVSFGSVETVHAFRGTDPNEAEDVCENRTCGGHKGQAGRNHRVLNRLAV